MHLCEQQEAAYALKLLGTCKSRQVLAQVLFYYQPKDPCS